MTKSKNVRSLKTLKHIADNFGKENRKPKKKEHLLEDFCQVGGRTCERPCGNAG